MTDDHLEPEPDDAALSPDEARAAAALREAPPPRLDDLTRRHLVRRAMDAGPGHGRRWQWVAAAAAVVAVVVGAALLRPGGGEDTTAQVQADDVETPDEATDDEGAQPFAAEPEESTAPLHLGELASDEELLAALERFGTPPADAGPESARRDAEDPTLDLQHLAPRCADALARDFLTSDDALATFRGVEVVVILGTDPDGALAAYVLEAATCTPLEGWDPRRV